MHSIDGANGRSVVERCVQPLDHAASIPSGSVQAPKVSPIASDARLHSTAKQFEAMFMSEMLRLARPPSHAAGPFATGHAEKSWQIFMDQALGQAAVAKEGTGLTGEIENALRAAQGQRTSGTNR
jgi:Rod binding domain-containing protein